MCCKGKRARLTPAKGDRKGTSRPVTTSPSLKSLRISRDQSSDWQKLAAIPEEHAPRFLGDYANDYANAQRKVGVCRVLSREGEKKTAAQLSVVTRRPSFRVCHVRPALCQLS